MAVDGKDIVYVADKSTISKITSTGVVTTLVEGKYWNEHVPVSEVPFSSPDAAVNKSARTTVLTPLLPFNDQNAIAVDRAGNLYVADKSNNRIAKGTPVPTLNSARSP